MGVVAPNGIGLEAFWKSLLAAKSGVGPITLFDASNFKSRIAGEVKDFDPFDYIEAELKPKRMARHRRRVLASTRAWSPVQHQEVTRTRFTTPRAGRWAVPIEGVQCTPVERRGAGPPISQNDATRRRGGSVEGFKRSCHRFGW